MTGGFGGMGKSAEPPATAETTAAPQPAAEPAKPEGPTPEEIQAQIDQMLEEKTQALQKNIKQEYDQRIEEMQKQLQSAEDAAKERERRLAEAQAQAERDAQARRALQEQKEEQEQAAKPQEPAPAEGGAGDAKAGQTADAATQPQEKAGDVAQQLAQRQPAKAQQPVAKPAPEPKEPSVHPGDLVKPGPGVVQPQIITQARPVYPPVAARLNREATVDVQVLVDEHGRVIDAMISGNKARYGFDEAAVAAARKSVFRPANKDGVPVKMWTTIRFRFKR